jgi:hypothetical protein
MAPSRSGAGGAELQRAGRVEHGRDGLRGRATSEPHGAGSSGRESAPASSRLPLCGSACDFSETV